MRKHLWWSMCLVGVGVMAAAVLIPVNFWNAGWWRQLEADWWQLANRRGWGVGFREGFMLTGLAAGAVVVVAGLAVSLFGRHRRPSGGSEIVPGPVKVSA